MDDKAKSTADAFLNARSEVAGATRLLNEAIARRKLAIDVYEKARTAMQTLLEDDAVTRG